MGARRHAARERGGSLEAQASASTMKILCFPYGCHCKSTISQLQLTFLCGKERGPSSKRIFLLFRCAKPLPNKHKVRSGGAGPARVLLLSGRSGLPRLSQQPTKPDGLNQPSGWINSMNSITRTLEISPISAAGPKLALNNIKALWHLFFSTHPGNPSRRNQPHGARPPK